MHAKKLIAVLVAACAIAISVAAIAQGSSTKKTASKASTETTTTTGRPPSGAMGGGPGGMGRPGGAVHSVSVVPDKAGTAFITVTSDRGTVQSVDNGAGTITFAEGTESATYKTLTLTIPSDATITRDGKTATLSEIATKDRVSVSSSSEGTTVFAADSSFKPQAGAGKGGPPPGMRGPGGPPPNQEATGTETKSGTSAKSGVSPTTSE